jgi:hypothetical protein
MFLFVLYNVNNIMKQSFKDEENAMQVVPKHKA